ncbi:MAG: AraC family transcriptional regulator [Bacteroidota bacterium]
MLGSKKSFFFFSFINSLLEVIIQIGTTTKLLFLFLELNHKNRYIIQKKVKPQEESPFVAKARAIVLAELDNENFSIHELAQQLFLSRSQVHRKLKATTGMSTTIFVRNIRLQEAKKLLTTSNLSISEISYRVGFKTPLYFSQIFKKTFKKSPSALRKQLIFQ